MAFKIENMLQSEGSVAYELVLVFNIKYKDKERAGWGRAHIPIEWTIENIDENIIVDKWDDELVAKGIELQWDVVFPWDNEQGYEREKIIDAKFELVGVYNNASDKYKWIDGEKIVDDYYNIYFLTIIKSNNNCENLKPLRFRLMNQLNNKYSPH